MRGSIADYREFGGRKKTWIGDIATVLGRLKHPVQFDIELMETTEGIERLIKEVERSSARRLYDELSSSRFPPLNPAARGVRPDDLDSVCRMWKYLRTVVVSAHRRALTRLLCADHPFAVEQLRRKTYVPRDCRPCRYCDAETETEIHVLLECGGLDDLVVRREEFLGVVGVTPDSLSRAQCLAEPLDAINYFLEHDTLAPAFAKYVYDVFKLFPLSIVE